MEINVFKFCSGLRVLGYVMILLVAVIVGVSYYAVVSLTYGPLLLRGGFDSFLSFIIVIIFHVLLVLLLWSYIRVVLKDPGSVPENWRAVPGEESLEVGTSLAAAEDGFERRSRGGGYCIHCQNGKPPRCHHCSICQRCVLKMDHHCVWVVLGEEVQVFGFWASPYSHRVELALSLKGVPYEYIEEDILKNKSDLLLKYNPIHKKVPVFLHKGKPIVESIVILEYIEETWKVNPILPQSPYDKAIDRFWIKFIDDKCLPAVRKATFSPENERETAVEEACECLKMLESALNGKRFFGGDAIGMVDIAANFLTIWLRTIQEATGLEVLSVEKFPDLFKWTDDFISCSVVKESLPSTDKLLSFVKASLSQ